MISSVSSKVPNPPGIAINASASANIIAFLVCISSTKRISPTVVPLIYNQIEESENNNKKGAVL